MKKSVMACASLLLVCLWLASSARATIVDANEEWGMEMQPGESFTAIAHFIPDIPSVPDSLIFVQAPEWTGSIPFNYSAAGWSTALTDGGKTAYLFGPMITNDGLEIDDIFSYRLYFQWDDEDPLYDEDYPVILDIAVFNDQDLVRDFAWRGIPNGPYDTIKSTTWKKQYDPESEPYVNPIPEPVTICLLGLGAVFLRKRH